MMRKRLPGRPYFVIVGWLIGLIGGYFLSFAVARLLMHSLEQLRAGVTGWPENPWHDLSFAALGLLNAAIGHLLLQYRKAA
jgi:hypothetical protein